MSLKRTVKTVAITNTDDNDHLNNPVFNTIHVGPDDEAAGSYLVIEQVGTDKPHKIDLNWDEWDEIVKIVEENRKDWEWN